MTTRLERNIKKLARILDVDLTIVCEGNTGGYWSIDDADYISVPYCRVEERNNLARDIKRLGYKDDERRLWYLPDDYMVVFGASYGGYIGRYAKQVQYAIVKLIER